MAHKSMRPERWPDFKLEKTMKMDLQMLRRPFANAIGVWFRQREIDTVQNILFSTPFQSCELWSETRDRWTRVSSVCLRHVHVRDFLKKSRVHVRVRDLEISNVRDVKIFHVHVRVRECPCPKISVWDWEFAHTNIVCSSLIESLRGQTPDERYKMTGYTNNSQCVKATGHFESQCCYHNSLYDVFNAAVACCDENIGPQPKGTCGTHDSSDLWNKIAYFNKQTCIFTGIKYKNSIIDVYLSDSRFY